VGLTSQVRLVALHTTQALVVVFDGFADTLGAVLTHEVKLSCAMLLNQKRRVSKPSERCVFLEDLPALFFRKHV